MVILYMGQQARVSDSGRAAAACPRYCCSNYFFIITTSMPNDLFVIDIHKFSWMIVKLEGGHLNRSIETRKVNTNNLSVYLLNLAFSIFAPISRFNQRNLPRLPEAKSAPDKGMPVATTVGKSVRKLPAVHAHFLIMTAFPMNPW